MLKNQQVRPDPIVKKLFLLLLFFILPAYAFENASYSFNSADEATRFNNLTNTIRCVVCQNQSIADSNAPLAKDLRKKVYAMMLEKKSDQEIRDYLVKRYGDFILLKPRLSKLTIVLWAFPFIALGLIVLGLFKLIF